MQKIRNYNRFFIMLQEEDKGFSRGGKPTGYVKVEMKDEKTKVFVHVQNIELSVNSRVLKAYLLSSTYPSMNPLYLGTVELKGNNGSATRVFGKEELKKLGINAGVLDTAIIVCKDLNMNNEKQYVPLIGFKNSRWEWEVAFEASEIKKQEKDFVDTTVKTDEPLIDSTDSADEAQVIDAVPGEVEEEVNVEEKEKVPNTERIPQEVDMSEAIENVSTEAGVLDNGEEVPKDADIEEASQDVNTSDAKEKTMLDADTLNDVEIESTVETEEKTEQVSEPDLEKKDLQEKEEIHSINKECLDQNDFKQSTPWQDERNSIFDQLQRYSRHEEPFNDGDMGYKWWTITDCAFILNNAYSDYNTAFLLYNPYVIDTIHRHSHFLFGIKTDEHNRVRFICYAIPSRFGIEPHPLLYAQAYAYWIPKKGEKPVMGGLGYWIIIIDVDSGDLVFFGKDH